MDLKIALGKKREAGGEVKMVVEQDLGVMEEEKENVELIFFHLLLSQMDAQGGDWK